tara:strand:+ start:141 stop:656 length:516 start_codon:yes stop_codon:yes gene_type:complete
MGVTILKVSGMTCNGCRGGVEKALKKVSGVTSASVILDTKLATVRGTASPAALIAAVEAKGKSAELVAAPSNRLMGFVGLAALVGVGVVAGLLQSSEPHRDQAKQIVRRASAVGSRAVDGLITAEHKELVASRLVPMWARISAQLRTAIARINLPALIGASKPGSAAGGGS